MIDLIRKAIETSTLSKDEKTKALAMLVSLETDSDFLMALEKVGVDNWEGYDEARNQFNNLGLAENINIYY